MSAVPTENLALPVWRKVTEEKRESRVTVIMCVAFLKLYKYLWLFEHWKGCFYKWVLPSNGEFCFGTAYSVEVTFSPTTTQISWFPPAWGNRFSSSVCFKHIQKQLRTGVYGRSWIIHFHSLILAHLKAVACRKVAALTLSEEYSSIERGSRSCTKYRLRMYNGPDAMMEAGEGKRHKT